MNVHAAPPVIRDLDGASAARWDRFVEQRPEATFFHRAGWKTVIEKSFGHRTHYVFVERNGEMAGILPLVHVKSRLFGNALMSIPFGVYGGPVAVDDAVRGELNRHAAALAERLDVDYCEYRYLTPADDGWAVKSDLYCTFRRPIVADPDQNLKAIPRKQRAVVRHSLENGLTATLDDDVSDVYAVYAESVRNLGTPVFAKKYFRTLKDVFGADCELLTVRKDRTPVSAVLSFYFRDEVLPYYGGGTAEARRLGSNDYMYWDVMRRAGAAGRRVFDFGRSKVGTGSFSFKKNWGFAPQPLHYAYLLRRGDLPEINPLNPKYRLMIAAWKRLPLPVANLIGPHIVRNIG